MDVHRSKADGTRWADISDDDSDACWADILVGACRGGSVGDGVDYVDSDGDGDGGCDDLEAGGASVCYTPSSSSAAVEARSMKSQCYAHLPVHRLSDETRLRLLGIRGCVFKRVVDQNPGVKIRVRGRGSGFVETFRDWRREGDFRPVLCISSPSESALARTIEVLRVHLVAALDWSVTFRSGRYVAPCDRTWSWASEWRRVSSASTHIARSKTSLREGVSQSRAESWSDAVAAPYYTRAPRKLIAGALHQKCNRIDAERPENPQEWAGRRAEGRYDGNYYNWRGARRVLDDSGRRRSAVGASAVTV